jgi:hypothetical protein
MLDMRKATTILSALIFVCGLTVISFAQAASGKTETKPAVKSEVVKGKIVSIDTAKDQIVVKSSKTGIEKTITVDPKEITSLKTDENVRIKVKGGSNVAESIKEVVKAPATAKPAAK